VTVLSNGPSGTGSSSTPATASVAEDLEVQVTGGSIRGFSRRGFRIWRGIPYAAPPVGENRFRAPAPVVPWEGVRDATEFGPVAEQDRRNQVSTPMLRLAMSEDCLSLNVVAPAQTDVAPRPVMVFIHGGAYTTGSSQAIPNAGEALVREGGVVFVNLNYRLGALGYLDFSRYSTPERPLEVNLGLRDQVAALEWVRDNIAAFGGDPDNVTVFGESAGGNAVTTLLATPAASGLFARAIAQSAPPEAIYPSAVTSGWAEDYIELLRTVTGDDVSAPQTLLTSASAAQLVRAGSLLQKQMPDTVPGTIAFSPVIDGDYLPERPVEAIAAGRGARVPLVIGTNAREGSLFRGHLDLLARTKPRIRAVFARTERQARAELFARYRELPARGSGDQFAADYTFWYPSIKIAEAHAAYAPVYFYRFDVAPRLLNVAGFGATHGIDLFAVFDLSDTAVGWLASLLGGRSAFTRVGERMRRYWTDFARHGRLDDSWPRYGTSSRATLIFDEKDHVEYDPHGSRRRAWQAFVPHL
jgi:para-nitrobenzyl esterase